MKIDDRDEKGEGKVGGVQDSMSCDDQVLVTWVVYVSMMQSSYNLEVTLCVCSPSIPSGPARDCR